MTIKRKLISIFLILCMLMPMAMPTVLADDTDALSFGNVSSTTAVTATLSPSRLLALLTGETLSAAEVDYLDRYCDRVLEYYDRIPADRVQMYSRDDRLELTATAFTYEAENGATVTWIPREAVYADRAGVAMTKNGTVYEAELTGVSAVVSDRIGIVYACELSIPASVVNTLGSFAYADASTLQNVPTTAEYTAAYHAARAAYEAYLRALDQYNDAQAAYEQYLMDRAEYETEKAKYDDYVIKKAAYDEAKIKYDDYVAAMAVYAEQKAAYDVAYRESTTAAEAYRIYLENRNRIRASMTAIESLFERPTSKKTRELYLALQNAELVTMFERYRGELVRIYGVSDATLTHLRETSDELNTLLGEYAEARETSEEAAFTYYAAHYTEISRLFNYLYDSMREIMTGMIFNHICAKMELEYGHDPELMAYKKWRVKNVLAHIYLICQTLDDAETADGTFNFYAENGKKHTYYFSDLLEQNLILTDNNNANPQGLTWLPEREPVTFPTPPVEPTPVDNPIPPQTVTEPRAPTPVTEPQAPTAVTEPQEATADELAQYARADRAAAIVAALKAGTLRARTPATAPQALTLTATLSRPISFGNGQIVTLYHIDGTILDAFERVSGDVVSQPSLTPSYSDAQYVYDFAGFATDPDASPENLPTSFTVPSEGDLALYAIFRKTLRRYSVTVKLHEDDPVPQTTKYDWGTMPTLPTTPQRTSPSTIYTFTGWSPLPQAVTGDVTYTAQWQESVRFYTVRWITPSGTVERREPYHETQAPTPPTVPVTYYEGCVRYDFIGWGQTVRPVTADVTYEAQYRRTVLAAAEEDELTLTPSLGEYALSGTGERAEIGGLLAVADTESKRVTLTYPSLTVALDAAAVAALHREGVAFVACLSDTAGGVGLGFYDVNGHALTPAGGVMRLSLTYTPTAGAIACVMATDTRGNSFLVPSSAEGESLIVEAMAHRTYRTDWQYPLTVKGEGGALFANANRYFPGDRPSLTTYPAPNYILSSITLTNDVSGETVTLESLGGFTMPAYAATLTVTFVPRTYTVTFISRGTVVSEKQYELGATVEVPEIETDFEQDGYRHTFIGWSSPIATVTGDATYTAKFFSVSLEEAPPNSDGTAWAIGTVLWQIGLPAVLIFAALTTGTVILICRLRRKKKNKKKKKPDPQA